MSVASSLLGSLLGGSQLLRDYQNAAKTFISDSYQLAPKYKFMFYVNFVLNPSATTLDTTTVSHLVKSVDLPKFTVETQELNQYNKKVIAQTKIKYQPVSIRFHDDNSDNVRELWRDYYNYYYADGRYQAEDLAYDDKYQAQRRISNWGLNAGSDVPYLTSVEIYSMHAGQASKVTLFNPIITEMQHDTHAHDESAFMTHGMSLHYTSVKYETGYIQGIPGFADFQFYDTTPSSISPISSLLYMNPSTGQTTQAPTYFTDPYQSKAQKLSIVNQQLNASALNQPIQAGVSNAELNNIVNQNVNYGSAYAFPTFPPNHNDAFNQTNNVVTYPNPTAISDGVAVPTPDQLRQTYQRNSWQQRLRDKGYTTDQINAADQYLAHLQATGNLPPGSNLQGQAEAFLAGSTDNATATATTAYLTANTNPASANLNFNDPTQQPTNAVYNSNDWKNTLSSEGYSAYQINHAATFLSSIRIAPGVDVTPLARNFIENYHVPVAGGSLTV
jgi:hypothetical protein